MPFVVRDLFDEQRKPVIVHPEDSLQVALTRMTEHEYSQLPVVDGDGRNLGMVTSDSILRALKTFDVTPGSLLVRDAKTKASVFREDDDLFDLLDDLRDSYAVLIVDEDKRVTGIVTGYDATEYFRRRTEDMMWVEDVEAMLKDLIQAAHTDSSGGTDEAALYQTIQQCARGASTNRKYYFAALQRYLERCDPAAGEHKQAFNKVVASEVFAQTFQSEVPNSLDKLTFADYEEMLLSKGQWPHFIDVFEPVAPDAVRRMLDSVRETRNVLAHFRADVTPEQHDRLKFCVEWLRAHPAVRLPRAALSEAEIEVSSTLPSQDTGSASADTSSATGTERELPDEVIEPRDSRYAPLALFLRGQSRDRDRLSLTFSEVEDIIQGLLPPYARQHRAFWSNDTVSHPQSRQWLDVDWRVASVDMSNEVVAFSRIKEREKQYIDFFSALMARVRESAQFGIRPGSPGGQSWITVCGMPEQGPQVGTLAFAFARNHRFRLELYINSDSQDRNKRIFDYLYARKHEVEEQLLPESDDSMSNPLNISLGWERLTEKRASRVALYCLASITDYQDERDLTIAWAAGATPQFHMVMNRLVTDAVRQGA